MQRSTCRRFLSLIGLVVVLMVSTPMTARAQARETLLSQTHRGSLAAGDAINSTDGSFQDDYVIHVEQGWIITATLIGTRFDPYVWILSPNQASAQQLASQPGTRVVTLTHTAETSGSFIVRANSNTAGETGDYTLQITAGPGRIAVGTQQIAGAVGSGAVLGAPQQISSNLAVPDERDRLRQHPRASGVVYTSGSGAARLQVVGIAIVMKAASPASMAELPKK